MRYFIRSVEADRAADGTDETTALLDRLLAYKGVRSALKAPMTDKSHGPVLPMHFRKGDVSLRLFTTIATLGTPQDVTAQELRVESFFPMDAETETVLRAWVPKRRGRIEPGERFLGDERRALQQHSLLVFYHSMSDSQFCPMNRGQACGSTSSRPLRASSAVSGSPIKCSVGP